MKKERWDELFKRLTDDDLIPPSTNQRIEKLIEKCIYPERIMCGFKNLDKGDIQSESGMFWGQVLPRIHIDTNVIGRIVSGGYCDQVEFWKNGLSILGYIEKGKAKGTILENTLYKIEEISTKWSKKEDVGRLLKSLICQIPNLSVKPLPKVEKVKRYLGYPLVEDFNIEDRAQIYIAKKEGAVMLSYDAKLLLFSEHDGCPRVITPEQMLGISLPSKFCGNCDYFRSTYTSSKPDMGSLTVYESPRRGSNS